MHTTLFDRVSITFTALYARQPFSLKTAHCTGTTVLVTVENSEVVSLLRTFNCGVQLRWSFYI